MGEKSRQLDALFVRWRKRFGQAAEEFAADGIVDEPKWTAGDRQILFLMKDTNRLAGDLRAYLRESPWKPIGIWAYGLQKLVVDYVPPLADAYRYYGTACRSSAIVNLKKLSGVGRADSQEIEQAAQRDRDFLAREIEIIDPDVIVCCGTFKTARVVFPGLGDAKTVDDYRRCAELDGRTWINYCHPAAHYPRDMTYYGLVAAYQQVLVRGQ